MIGLVAVTAGGRAAAASLREVWPSDVHLIELPNGSDALRDAWRNCDAIVSFLAVGATVRVLAPLLGDKTTDPPVVCVDEAREFAVAVLGGHHGANTLAHRVSAVLGCRPVITTASDQANLTPLDSFGADLGFTVQNPEMLASVGAAVLSGTPVRLENPGGWPIPPLPRRRGEGGDLARAQEWGAPSPGQDRVTDRLTARSGRAVRISDEEGVPDGALVYRPKSLGGGRVERGVAAEEIEALIDEALAGFSPGSVRALATIDLKADEAGIVEAAEPLGVRY